ncbi:MAG: hypothetical protein QXS38_00060 [Candidatus Pacearchaeota archaeon]
MSEKRQVRAEGLLYTVVKQNNFGDFHKHGRKYNERGIAVYCHQAINKKLGDIELSFESEELKNKIYSYIKKHIFKGKLKARVDSDKGLVRLL